MKLSVIIPALNEERALALILPVISRQDHEIILVDGGSRDETKKIALQYTSQVFTSGRGRGTQQAYGASRARGEAFLFLHADTRPPDDYGKTIEEVLADPGTAFGAFGLKIHPPSPTLNLIAHAANIRSRFLKLPYGDQGLFMRRKDYFRAGGFRDIPIMEDVDLVKRLKGLGGFKLGKGYVKTSDRRWRREGILYTTIRNWSLMIRYAMGASPGRLHGRYEDRR